MHANLVAEHRAGSHGGQGRLPPDRGAAAIDDAVAVEGKRDDQRVPLAHAAAAFGIGRAVDGVIDIRVADAAGGVADLGPQRHRLAGCSARRGGKLRVGGAVDIGVLRAVIDPVGSAGVGAHAAAFVEDEAGAADRALPSFRTGRADDLAAGVGFTGRKFFHRACDEAHLLVAEESIARGTRRIVAAGGEAHLGIQVDARVELHQEVRGRTVGPRHEAEVGGIPHHRHLDGVGVGRIPVRTVFALDADGRDRDAVFLNLNRLQAGALPDRGDLRDVVGKREVAARRDQDRIEVAVGAQLAIAADRRVESPPVG